MSTVDTISVPESNATAPVRSNTSNHTSGPTIGNQPRYDASPGFGATLRAFRERRRVSQTKLAQRAGFDHSYVSRIESGARTPTRDAIFALAKALELKPDDTTSLIIAAGFLPDDPAMVLADEPAVANLYRALASDRLPDDVKELMRSQVVLIVEQATALMDALTTREERAA